MEVSPSSASRSQSDLEVIAFCCVATLSFHLKEGIHGVETVYIHFAGVRLGCYGPAKTLLGDTKENKSVVRNIAAGSLSGALAAWASNPIDLIKTRLQSKENPHRTSSAVVKSIVQTDGIRGLWRGTVPSTVSFLPLTALCSRTGSLSILCLLRSCQAKT